MEVRSRNAVVALKLKSPSFGLMHQIPKQERRGGIETPLRQPPPDREEEGSRNAVVALKPSSPM